MAHFMDNWSEPFGVWNHIERIEEFPVEISLRFLRNPIRGPETDEKLIAASRALPKFERSNPAVLARDLVLSMEDVHKNRAESASGRENQTREMKNGVR
jgi:hypothetical protein